VSQWGWRPERTHGIWKYGAPWLRPFIAAVPFLTIILLVLMMFMAEDRLTVTPGTLFDLPQGEDMTDVRRNCPVVMLMPKNHETMAFFDDVRYVLGDDASERQFFRHLSDRVVRSESKTLMVLADKRVTCDVLLRLASTARHCGAAKVLFAQKQVEAVE